jgi:uracil phosphoribosyltransferase
MDRTAAPSTLEDVKRGHIGVQKEELLLQPSFKVDLVPASLTTREVLFAQSETVIAVLPMAASPRVRGG